MTTFAELAVRIIWKAWFRYAMATLAFLAALALPTLLSKEWISGETFAVIWAAVFIHHFWLFALERWLRREGSVAEMGKYRAWLFSANFYIGMVVAPVYLVSAYLVQKNA